MADLSPEVLQQLRQHIEAAMRQAHAATPTPMSASAPTAPKAPAGAPMTSADFCAIWPTAKPVLGALTGIAALIPGVGATAAAVLPALVTVGDQIFNATCKKP